MPTIRIAQPAPAKPSKKDAGSAPLAWNAASQQAITSILARYPAAQSRSALIPVLWLAQRQFGGWLSTAAMQLVADTLSLPYIRVYEVASFYTMFNLQPVGTHHVQVCTNCSCLVRGSDAIVAAVKKFTGITELNEQHQGHSANGQFTLTEVECLGACVAAPMLQVTSPDGLHYFTNLTPEKTTTILKALAANQPVTQLADTPPASVDPITHAKYGA